MIDDHTDKLTALISDDLREALDALVALDRHFGRETMSTAIGELSERLVAKYIGGGRTKRGSQGHDIVLPNGDMVEIKSRFLAHYADTLQFNFGHHTQKAHTVFCMVWVAHRDEPPRLERALQITVPFLMEKWATPTQSRYCARTTLGKLKMAVSELGLSTPPPA